ncbi:unnamed protein product [Lepeophtheirus salmonis]|uniref:(salmon louse) hypothetical protein n=1 Tax=Lepeophtheirus salmonis TaxID=72036 RepID=A0A7R8D187_LEPSM|nr:unnamed protein product [Lepeophtheirus salmonis]CAF2992649.1 unnamed protein product [Lepeophtheirus salmonis]
MSGWPAMARTSQLSSKASEKQTIKVGRSVLQLKLQVSSDGLNPPRYTASREWHVLKFQELEIANARDGRGRTRDNNGKLTSILDGETTIPQFLGAEFPSSFDILNPLQYLNQFQSDDFLDLLVKKTSLFSAQQNNNKALIITLNKLGQCIGLVCYFSISKLPNTTMHWNKNDMAGAIMDSDRIEAKQIKFHMTSGLQEALLSAIKSIVHGFGH